MRFIQIFTLGLALLVASSAGAQVQETSNFSAERMRLSLNREGVIDAEWGRVLPHLRWDVGLMIGYARNPVVLLDLDSRRQVGAYVQDRLGASLFGTIGFLNWLEVGIELPFSLYQNRPSNQPLAFTADLNTLSAVGIGDVRVAPKVRLLRSDQHVVDLAIYLPFTLPSGGSRAYLGEPSVTFKPEVILSRAWRGPRAVLNLGADVRAMSAQGLGSELTYRLGFGYRFKDIGRLPFELDTTLSGAFSAVHPFQRSAQNPLEARVMGAYEFLDWFQVFIGGGAGLTPGLGTPDFRVFAGLRIGNVKEPPAPASEPASVPASEPASTPVVVRLDSDNDDIYDDVDQCVDQPEDFDQFEDSDGCPEPDNDKDGLPDAQDRCPNVAGPAENRGCPDQDTDNDTVVDRLDNCPTEAGPVENHGCAKKQLVVITKAGLEILEAVYFEPGKAKIKPVSFALLDNVAEVINTHPDAEKIRVEGHTDNKGRAESNLTLSQARAEAVVQYLVDHGVAAARLEAKGYGQTRAIAPNASEKGRARNRRVEFVIVGASQ